MKLFTQGTRGGWTNVVLRHPSLKRHPWLFFFGGVVWCGDRVGGSVLHTPNNKLMMVMMMMMMMMMLMMMMLMMMMMMMMMMLMMLILLACLLACLLVCVCAPLFWIRPWNLTSTTLFISRVLKVRIYIESQVFPHFSSKNAGT